MLAGGVFSVLAGGGGVVLVAFCVIGMVFLARWCVVLWIVGLVFWQKWLKVSLAKMAKKRLENLVMEIILFNTRFLRVPKIRLLRVVKRNGLRLELANLAKF